MKQYLALFVRNLHYLLVFVLTIAYCLQRLPMDQFKGHLHASWLSLAAILLSVAFFLLWRKFPGVPWPWTPNSPTARSLAVKIAFTLLACAAAYSAFNYYRFSRINFTTVGDYMDVTYYYTNSKYWEELGPFNLYTAILIADEEGARRMLHVKRIRDLHSYKMISRARALTPERIERVKSAFSPARWEAFKLDVAYLSTKYGGWSYFMIDRGYNPPATWTGIGTVLSNLVPVQRLKVLTMIDFVLMAVAFVCVARAYGMGVMLFSLLWFFITFSGRWPMLGQAFLRFDWVAGITIAVCMLKLKRPAIAGGCFTFAALSRVFPAFFVVPYGIAFVRDVLRERRVSRAHLRFIAGCAIVLSLESGWALHRLGAEAFVDTFTKLKIHSESYSYHRVGLGTAWFYRGETTEQELNLNGGLEGKRLAINRMKPDFALIALAAMGLVALYIVWRRPPMDEVVYYGILPIFCIAVLQTNYYNMRLVCAVAHASRLDLHRNKALLILLFLVETFTQYVMAQNVPRFVVTAAMSWGMLIYLCAVVAFLLADLAKPARPAVREAVQGAGLAAPAA